MQYINSCNQRFRIWIIFGNLVITELPNIWGDLLDVHLGRIISLNNGMINNKWWSEPSLLIKLETQWWNFMRSSWRGVTLERRIKSLSYFAPTQSGGQSQSCYVTQPLKLYFFTVLIFTYGIQNLCFLWAFLIDCFWIWTMRMVSKPFRESKGTFCVPLFFKQIYHIFVKNRVKFLG